MVLPNSRRIRAQYNIENLVCSIGCVGVVATVARAPEDPRVWSTTWSILLIGGVAALLSVPTAFSAPRSRAVGSAQARCLPRYLPKARPGMGACGGGDGKTANLFLQCSIAERRKKTSLVSGSHEGTVVNTENEHYTTICSYL